MGGGEEMGGEEGRRGGRGGMKMGGKGRGEGGEGRGGEGGRGREGGGYVHVNANTSIIHCMEL